MATSAIPKSRLDTLPVEVLRQIFDNALYDTVGEYSECSSNCDCESDHEGDEPDDEGEDGEHGEEGGEDDSDSDSDDNSSIASGATVDREDEDRSGYDNIVAGLAADPLNSDLVRRMAREQQYRIAVPYSLDQLAATTDTLQADPELGYCVRRVRLCVLTFRESKKPEVTAARTKTTKEQHKRIDRLEAQHKALFRSPQLYLEPFTRPYGYEEPAYWARSAVRVLDLLNATPGLRELHACSPGLAVIPIETDEKPLLLGRLHRLYIQEPYGGGYDRPVLDTDCALLRCAPDLGELELRGIGRVVSSENKEEVGLRHLTKLELSRCEMTAASLQRLLAVVGPRLQSVDANVTRRTARPSEGLHDPQNFTTYDVLAALARWQTTSLTELDLHTRMVGRDDDEEGDVQEETGTSVMSLFPAFTALRELAVCIELLDWCGAGGYLSGYNAAASAGGGDGPNEAATGLARVAADLVAQLPPNLQAIHITGAIHTIDDEVYTKAWLPRRAALAQALVAATRADQFPHLATITVHPYERTTAKYEVKAGDGDDDKTTTRTILLKTELAAEIVEGRTYNVYSGVNDRHAAMCQSLLRPGEGSDAW